MFQQGWYYTGGKTQSQHKITTMIQTGNNLYNKMSEYTEYRDKPLKKALFRFSPSRQCVTAKHKHLVRN